MKLSPKINWLIDYGGLIIALAVDLTIGVICFATMAPDELTKIAFVLISVMLVLFVARAWVKKQKALWFACAIVVFFFDVSFVLVSTDTQATNATVATDDELSRLTTKSNGVATELKGLQKQYADAATRQTLDQLDVQISKATKKQDEIEQDRKARFEIVASGKVITRPITTKSIFSAIPDAIVHLRIIELLIWLFVAGAIQGMIVASLSEVEVNAPEKRQYRKRAEQPEIDVMVERWVEANFSGDNGKIIERKVFKKLHVERKIPFSDGAYQAILDAAVRSGVITITGDIIEFNKNIAITKILSGSPVWRGMNKGGVS